MHGLFLINIEAGDTGMPAEILREYIFLVDAPEI